MVTTIKKGTSKETIIKTVQNSDKKKGFDAKKHQGSVKLNQSTIEIQKKLRNEWS